MPSYPCTGESENAVYLVSFFTGLVRVTFLSGDWVKPSEILFTLAPSPALPLAETLRE